MRFPYAVVVLVILNLGPLAHAQPKGRRPLSVVATTTVVADLCRIIGGERVKVVSVVGPNQDPHSFKPSFRELALIKSADVLVSMGFHLEAGLEKALEQVAGTKPLIVLAASLPPGSIIREGDSSGTPDPHFWGDVSLWAGAGEYLARELGAIDVGSRQDYLHRGEDYRRHLTVLHRELITRLKEPPSGQRILATPHGSLAYFAAAYGWRTTSAAGIKPLIPGDDAATTSFATKLQGQKVSLLFAENTLSSQPLDDAVERSTQQGFPVLLRGELWVDALGPSDSPVSTYEAMIRANVETILTAVAAASVPAAPKPRETASAELAEPQPRPTAEIPSEDRWSFTPINALSSAPSVRRRPKHCDTPPFLAIIPSHLRRIPS